MALYKGNKLLASTGAGASAYEQAVAGGYQGTEEEFNLFLASAEAKIEGALTAANKYTDEQIATIPTPDVSGQIGEHNSAEDAHPHIQGLIEELTKRLNAVANSDDETLDQLAELVAYIKENRELIESVTGIIVDDLVTDDPKKALSAAQGVALKGLIDALPAWAKEENKPTYTADEVGARADSWIPDSIIEQNVNNEEKFWVGTKAEYDAIAEKDQQTIYMVTDDIFGSYNVKVDDVEGLSEALEATKAYTDEKLAGITAGAAQVQILTWEAND